MKLLTCSNHAAIMMMAALVFNVTSSVPSWAQDATPAGEEMTDEQYQKAFMDHIESFGWQRDGVGRLKGEAEIDIPSGFRFTGPKGAAQLMETYGNPASDREYGLIAPEGLEWCVLFEFDKSGYVKDDEKDSIDSSKLLSGMKKNQKEANRYRVDQGLDELTITGWAHEPSYNSDTNNLEWALNLLSSEGGETVNYNTRLLGRYGVMESVLICNPEDLEAVLPVYQDLIAGYRYTNGHRYAEYQSGDKIAKYGLTALIAGGGAAIAAKTGLFAGLFKIIAKGGKAVFLGIAALFAGVINAFKRLFGRGE
ncbi:MAG: DUF2167 domain-containing protein [Verrucomicrobiae bacterium]|nr:DUF2167 domain-containing protein [Verrucomicrobiae bacterium]